MRGSKFPGKHKKWDEDENLLATAAYETLTEEERSTAKTNQAKLVYAQLRAWYPKWTRPIDGKKIEFLSSKAENRTLCQQLVEEKDENEELRKRQEDDTDALQKARACVVHEKRKNKKLASEMKKLEEDLAANVKIE